jgi:hypothetical protein
MRTSLLVFLVLLVAAPAAPAQAPKYPAPGSDLPGPFYSYMATGKRKGKFHCLVTEHELNPVVMVIVRGVEKNEPLRNLLTKLNNAVDRNPNARLASFAVFLTDRIKDLAREDDNREELEKKLEDVARDANLQHVTVALDLQDRLQKYKVEEADIVVILYNRYRVVSFHSLKRDQLTDAKAKEILGEVAEKLGARR